MQESNAIMSTPHLFCFGLGYTGLRLAKRLQIDDWQISGTCRGEMTVKTMTNQGIRTFPFSGSKVTNTLIPSALSEASHILSTVPPSSQTGDPVWHVFNEVLADLKHLKWIGYLSTTGVYGNTYGREVDENAPLNPSSDRARRRVIAETSWMSLYEKNRLPVHIFRLPGIYGPGRSSLNKIRKGDTRSISKPGHQFNRIHVDDIVETLIMSMAKPNSGAVYNVSDDEPAAPSDLNAYACKLLGLEPSLPIPFKEMQHHMSEMALSFWRDNRRVSNRRIKQELSVKLQYPNYRVGLMAIHNQEADP